MGKKGSASGNGLAAVHCTHDRGWRAACRSVANPSRTLRAGATAPADGEKGQQVAGVETGIDALEFEEAAHHQTAADQQHEG